MTKLHELIAVEPELKGEAQKSLVQVRQALSQPNLFVGEIRTYQPIDEEGEPFPDETTNISTTVDELLNQLEENYGAWMDVGIQKELSNVDTNSDVVVGENILFANMPSPALLNLEAKLEELKAIFSALPVLDPAERWDYDDGMEIYVSDPRITYRTKKMPRNHMKAEATKEHPAQVEVYTEDVRVGTWTKIIHCGAVTVHEKREMLGRLDELIRAVKQARQRANDVEANLTSVSGKVFNYIRFGEWE